MHVKTLVKDTARKVLHAVLPDQTYDRLMVDVVGQQWNYNIWDVEAFHRASYPQAEVLSAEALREQVFRCHYEGRPLDGIMPAMDVPFARSFVPVSRSGGCVHLYNFFDQHYALRDPLYFRFILMSNGRPVRIWARILTASQVVAVPMDEVFAGSDATEGVLIIEARHPRISVLGDQLRYHGITQSGADHTVCTVHSVPVGRHTGVPVPSGNRGFQPSALKVAFWNATGARVDNAASPQRKVGPLDLFAPAQALPSGSVVLTSSAPGDAGPRALWHDNGRADPDGLAAPRPVAARANGKNLPLRSYTFVPDMKQNAPLILISRQHTLIPTETATVVVTEMSSGRTETASFPVGAEGVTADLRHMVGDRLTGPCLVEIDLDRNAYEYAELPSGVVLVTLRNGDAIADSTHAHCYVATWTYHDNPPRKPGSFRCRKFAPYLNDAGLDFTYSIYTKGAPHGEVIKVRIVTDRNREYLTSIVVDEAPAVYLDGNDLMRRLGVEMDRAAAVILENGTYNFVGDFFIRDKQSGHIGVDHFTGA